MVSRSPNSKKTQTKKMDTVWGDGRYRASPLHQVFKYTVENGRGLRHDPTRSSTQIRSHAQKYFAKLKKEALKAGKMTFCTSHETRCLQPISYSAPFSPNTVNAAYLPKRVQRRPHKRLIMATKKTPRNKTFTKVSSSALRQNLHLLDCRRACLRLVSESKTEGKIPAGRSTSKSMFRRTNNLGIYLWVAPIKCRVTFVL